MCDTSQAFIGHDESRPCGPQSMSATSSVAIAIALDYALDAHTASLGLAFDTGALFPHHTRNGAFTGQHGSWNRIPRSGYRVAFVPFENGKPSGAIDDVPTGFVNKEGKAMRHP